MEVPLFWGPRRDTSRLPKSGQAYRRLRAYLYFRGILLFSTKTKPKDDLHHSTQVVWSGQVICQGSTVGQFHGWDDNHDEKLYVRTYLSVFFISRAADTTLEKLGVTPPRRSSLACFSDFPAPCHIARNAPLIGQDWER